MNPIHPRLAEVVDRFSQEYMMAMADCIRVCQAFFIHCDPDIGEVTDDELVEMLAEVAAREEI